MLLIGCIIQARMGSSRLPGKVMKILDDKNPLLFYVINQLKYSKLIDKIIIATTTLKEDDIIEIFCKSNKIECFRGKENDVLDRHYQCAVNYSLSTIVRIPSDKPLIDPEIVDLGIKIFNEDTYDYVSNFHPYSYPYGTEVEIFSFKTLQKIWKEAKLPSEREHVIPYVFNNQNKFSTHNFLNSENISHLRWEVDRENDLKLVKIIISNIKNEPILTKDIVKFLHDYPEYQKINKNISRNEGHLKSLEEDKKFRNSSKI
jgi:spore coat polysaccharide biosynthesis protein SpsF